MSVLYESAEDLKREDEVAQYLCEVFGYEGWKLVGPQRADRLMKCNGEAASVWEIKTRTKTHAFFCEKYGSYMIDVEKLSGCLALGELYNVNVFAGVRFACLRVFMVPVTWASFRRWRTGPGGRRDRNDPNDLDPCKYIPMSELKWVRRASF